MNILIVGNGFDLSHYLPTKYDHFMVAMDAIESWDELKGDMGFDDLFGSLYQKESYFFGYTKAMYKTDDIKISVDQIKELKVQLKENIWYQYFSDHVREVKTWIDFETKIEVALKLVCKFINKINLNFEKYGKFEKAVKMLTKENADIKDNNFYVSELDLKLLIKLGLCVENHQYGHTEKFGGMVSMPDRRKGFLSQKWYYVSEKSEYGFAVEKYIWFLNNQLDLFISIFENYLVNLVQKLNPDRSLKFDKPYLKDVDKIYSFNYTKTFSQFYKDDVNIDFLHGRAGGSKNIVLGISDIKDSFLKNIKAYGFTKYHQKLFKNTDYLFLDQYKNKIVKDESDISKLTSELIGEIRSGHRTDKTNKIRLIESQGKLNLKISIWGHSLDVSDEIYIKDIFSLNNEIDRDVRLKIYYFNDQAKFDLLTNLLHILGKDVIELWMKKGWLKFEKNPDIAEINDIKLIDLPKM